MQTAQTDATLTSYVLTAKQSAAKSAASDPSSEQPSTCQGRNPRRLHSTLARSSHPKPRATSVVSDVLSESPPNLLPSLQFAESTSPEAMQKVHVPLRLRPPGTLGVYAAEPPFRPIVVLLVALTVVSLHGPRTSAEQPPTCCRTCPRPPHCGCHSQKVGQCHHLTRSVLQELTGSADASTRPA